MLKSESVSELLIELVSEGRLTYRDADLKPNIENPMIRIQLHDQGTHASTT